MPYLHSLLIIGRELRPRDRLQDGLAEKSPGQRREEVEAHAGGGWEVVPSGRKIVAKLKKTKNTFNIFIRDPVEI